MNHIDEVTVADLADGRAELLRDGKGIFGLTFANHDKKSSIIIRADIVNQVGELHSYPVLQTLPRHGFFKYSAETYIADALLTALLARVGLHRYNRGSEPWWSYTPAGKAKNRRTFYALKGNALAITNKLIRAALTSAHPEALTMARRFPPSARYAIYQEAAISPRFLQLCETFPAAAYLLTRRNVNGWVIEGAQKARQLVEKGHRLRDVASCLGIPCAMRRIKPGAVTAAFGKVPNTKIGSQLEPYIHNYMPDTLPGQRRWLRAVAQAHEIGGPYVEWVARNASDLGTTIAVCRAQVQDIGDWVRACYVSDVPSYTLAAIRRDAFAPEHIGEDHITRTFSPDMSLVTVRALVDKWHEDVALASPSANFELPPPWRPAAQIGDLDVLPLTTVADIAREGREMHHCVATRIESVARGSCYLFSVRDGDQRIGTIEVQRSNGHGTVISQVRGPCNKLLSKPITTKLNRWATQRDAWTLPPDIECPEIDEEIPF